MAQAVPTLNEETLSVDHFYLPLERFVRNRFLAGRSITLIPWVLVGYLACTVVFFISLHGDTRTFWRLYAAPVAIGVVAIACDVLFLLRSSELIRNKLPIAIKLLHEGDRRDCCKRLGHLVYGRWRLSVSVLTVLSLGLLTFFGLGLTMPSRRMTILALIAIGLIFVLCGAVAAIVVGFWTWMHEFGNLRPRIQVFHFDQMGGLAPVADVSDWVVSMGFVLAALYSAGAYFSPYAHIELKRFAYLWVAGAVIMLAVAFYVPSYSIHRCLVEAKERLAKRLGQENERLYEALIGEQADLGKPEQQFHFVALVWVSEAVHKLNLWPYRQMGAKAVVLVGMQLAPLVIKVFLK
jgi:hypothetical protein